MTTPAAATCVVEAEAAGGRSPQSAAEARIPPRILLLRAPTSDAGPSMTRYARELSSALTALCGSSRVIALDQPLPRRYVSRLLDHQHTRRLDNAWSRYVAYPRSLRRRAAELFHVTDQADAHLVRVLDADRTVVTCHDVIPLLAADGVLPIRIAASVVRTFRWRIAHLAKARMVIVDSHATKAALEQYSAVPPQRIAVVQLGVNAVFRPIETTLMRRSVNVADAAPVLLQVASAGRYKNTTTLLHALARLRSRLGPDLILVRIGVPLYADEAALASRLGVAHAIRYIGRVDDATLAMWYNAADVLVFPSLWEGFGWPPLEAMACGTPVVASNVPAITEVVGDAGLLVPPCDQAAIADAVEQVLTDRARAASMRARGLARAREFTWARTAASTMAVYEAVLADQVTRHKAQGTRHNPRIANGVCDL